MNELSLQLIHKYLFQIKSDISQKKYQFIERKKNIEFLKQNGLTIDDLLQILYDLSPDDYLSGPENDINIISFHENE